MASKESGSAAPTSSKANEKAPELVEEYPDPDEDDLDDLDDMLDDFSSVKLGSKKADTGPARTAATQAEGSAPFPEPSVEDVLNDEDFAKQLQAGMADLLGEIEKSPEMQAQFEDMFKQLGVIAAEAEANTTPAAATSDRAAKEEPDAGSFQDKIRKTMERMQESGDQATAAASSAGDASDDFLAEMLKQLGGSGAGGLDGGAGEEEFSKMLVGMMEQLTAKEILYEPMKELDTKFPDWLAKNRAVVPKDDVKRYELQQGLVRKIVAKFEEQTYSDNNAKDREYVVELMQEMQAAGAPPSDLIGDMATAQDALGGPEEGCNPQ